jgi:hypothetical protein
VLTHYSSSILLGVVSMGIMHSRLIQQGAFDWSVKCWPQRLGSHLEKSVKLALCIPSDGMPSHPIGLLEHHLYQVLGMPSHPTGFLEAHLYEDLWNPVSPYWALGMPSLPGSRNTVSPYQALRTPSHATRLDKLLGGMSPVWPIPVFGGSLFFMRTAGSGH